MEFFISKFYAVVFFVLLSNISACLKDESPVEKAVVSSVNEDSIRYVKQNQAKIKLLDAVFKERVATGGFNGCILVAEKGHVIYRNVAGYANLKKKEPLKLNSAFQLASTSKTMTAGAILLLRDQGKLQLTDNVKKFFPNFPYDKITIQLLLTHRSGLSNYVYFSEPYCDVNKCYNGKTFDNSSVLDIINCYAPSAYYAPNKKFEYCNTNYALLASIIEKVSGQSYAAFMEQQIFKPLGMNDTWVCGTVGDSLCENRTMGHTPGGVAEKDTYADYVLGDKGIYSTIDDLYKWSEALYSGKILKKETLDEAYTGYSNEHPGKRNYGYGWRLIEDTPGQKIVYHNGWWHGYSSLFYRRISDETTVILLSNKYNSSTYHIEDILSVLDAPSNVVATAKKTVTSKKKNS